MIKKFVVAPFFSELPIKQKDIINVAESLQEEFHRFANELSVENPKIEYQDALATWLYGRLASMSIEITELKREIIKLKNNDKTN